MMAEKINIDRVGRESIQLNEPYLNMCLFVQENIIQSLNRDFMEQGFVQRSFSVYHLQMLVIET